MMTAKTMKPLNQDDALSGEGRSRYFWKFTHIDPQVAHKLSLECNIPLPLASILVGRGMLSKSDLLKFLVGVTDSQDPTLLKDAIKAVERIERAIVDQEPILIFGDYDVDGMTSSAIGMLVLQQLGARVDYKLPHRVKDGYGLSAKAINHAHALGFKVVITVDNGTTAHEAALRAQELGIDLIITDHHQPKEQLPEVYALVNPHQSDCQYPYKYFCGAGVIFKLMQLLAQRAGLVLPEKVYELLALGTIADVVPLSGENRFWVKKGLAVINQQPSMAFTQLATNSKKNLEVWGSQDIGFGITPQLNALGRLDDPREAVNFLIGQDTEHISNIGQLLLELNEKRKLVEKGILQEIQAKIASKEIDLQTKHVIVAASANWPAGVIGLVAGKLMQQYGRPVLLFHLDEAAGLAKGSARSISGFDLFKALTLCEGLLKTFGGHPVAAGLSLDIDKLDILQDTLCHLVAEQFSIQELRPSLKIDLRIAMDEMDWPLFRQLQKLEPFGHHNPVPIFCFPKVILLGPPRVFQGQHLSCQVFFNGVTKKVMFFYSPELLQQFQANQGKPFDLVAQLSVNFWQGQQSLELLGLDVCFY